MAFPLSLAGHLEIPGAGLSPDSVIERVQVWLELQGAAVARTGGRLTFRFPFFLARWGAPPTFWMVDAGEVRTARESSGVRVEFEWRLVHALAFISLVLAGTFLMWAFMVHRYETSPYSSSSAGVACSV